MNEKNMIGDNKHTLADILGEPTIGRTYVLDLSSGPETYANICEKPAYDPKSELL